MTNTQIKLIAALCFALAALLLGCNIEDITRILTLLINLG